MEKNNFEQEILASLKEELENKFAEKLLKQWKNAKNVDLNLQEEIIKYFSKLNLVQIQEKNLTLAILLGQLLSKGKIEEKVFVKLQNSLSSECNQNRDENEKQYYAFMYYDNDKWNLKTNAYFPAVLQNWLSFQEQGLLVSGLVEKSYLKKDNWGKIKETFSAYAKDVLDAELLGIFALAGKE